MKLTSVNVKNFRGLAEVTVDLDDTTVLIGENNTGKTSFMEAIRICLAQGAARRSEILDDYDHHLAGENAQIGEAGSTEITLCFAEAKSGEWSNEVVQAISEVISLDGDLQRVRLRLSSSKDPKTGDMTAAWEFLDAAGNAMRPKRSVGFIHRDLQQLNPFFYLSAVRDATREFQPRSTFWGPFLRSPAISDELRKELEAELDALNTKVIAADDKLKDVKTRLEKTGDLVSLGDTAGVSIEAVPGRARDLLARAQVSVNGRTGASLPMVRHGAGTQSLSVLFLFEAFLTSMLESLYGKDSVPIVALEEPEAHLHPAATRALWKTIGDMPGQKLVATHSGDLLARVPLSSVRRFCHDKRCAKVHRLGVNTLDAADMRKVALHVKATRGELLFARTWLLVEGATEVWLFEGAAEILGIDLERQGVRIVQYAQVMPDPFIRLADDLGISWLVFSDGDAGGAGKIKNVPALMKARAGDVHLQVLTDPNIEVHLCRAGFGDVYLPHVAEQKKSRITAKPDAPEYWTQVVSALPGRANKEAWVIEVVDRMKTRGAGSVPAAVTKALRDAVALAGGNRGH